MGLNVARINDWLSVGAAGSCAEFDGPHVIHIFRSDVQPSQERDCAKHLHSLRMDYRDGGALDGSNMRNLDAFLENVRKDWGQVLVHCYAGMCRSPTVAVYALMKLSGMTPWDARHLVERKIYEQRDGQPCNFEFRPYRQLIEIWEGWQANSYFPGGELETILSLNGWCSKQKALRIAELVRGILGPVNGVEIGVFAGRSLFAAAFGCKTNVYGGHVLGVDSYDAEENLRGVDTPEHRRHWPQDLVDKAQQEMWATRKLLGLESLCDVLVGKSADVASKISDKLNYLHIDGNHSSDGATSDARLYLPKVKKGGLVIVDDTHPSGKPDFLDGVMRAVALVEECCELVEERGTWRVYRKVR